MRMLYDDFSAFSQDQEHLISINGALDYLEGSLITLHSPPNNWRSSFFAKSDYPTISSLLSKNGIVYCIEVVKYYDDLTRYTVDEVCIQIHSICNNYINSLICIYIYILLSLSLTIISQ